MRGGRERKLRGGVSCGGVRGVRGARSGAGDDGPGAAGR